MAAEHASRVANGAERVLRGLLAVMLVGAARGTTLHGSPVASVLWHDLGWSEAAFVGLDTAAAAVLYSSAALVLLLPRGARAAWALLPAALWLTLVPLAKLRAGGDFGYLLAPFTKGNRPLALAGLFVLWRGARNEALAMRLLVYGAAAVFASHGVEALLQNPRFVDYLLVSTARLTPWQMGEGTARALLYGIGVMDVSVAALVLRAPRRGVLVWACIWGFATAAMRLVYFGPVGGAHHAAIRALNGGGALTILLFLRAGVAYPRSTWRRGLDGLGGEQARARV